MFAVYKILQYRMKNEDMHLVEIFENESQAIKYSYRKNHFAVDLVTGKVVSDYKG